jgi:hypothetical protein
MGRRTQRNRRDEAVALGGHGDDKPRRIGIVIQRPPNLAHRSTDGVLAVDEDASTPYVLEDFLTGNELSATLNQKRQELERDTL